MTFPPSFLTPNEFNASAAAFTSSPTERTNFRGLPPSFSFSRWASSHRFLAEIRRAWPLKGLWGLWVCNLGKMGVDSSSCFRLGRISREALWRNPLLVGCKGQATIILGGGGGG